MLIRSCLLIVVVPGTQKHQIAEQIFRCGLMLALGGFRPYHGT